MSNSPNLQSFVVPDEAAGARLDQWLAAHLADISRVRVQQLIEQSKIKVNNSVPKPSLRLRGGEEIVIIGPVTLPPLKATAEDIPLDVVYEDADIAVINKPAGMTVHAGTGKEEAGSKGTLVNALLHRFGPLSRVGGELRPGIVHRLDKQTSGLLVVAKTDSAHRKLAQQFAQRAVKKTYVAFVHGWMNQARGTIDAPIGRDVLHRKRMTTRRRLGSKPGRSAVTHWKVLEQVAGGHGKFSLLEVEIETGRTHQIRVHLASIGHPVAGDNLYGAPRKIAGYRGTAPALATLERNFLHSFGIQFQHPTTNAPLAFQQPLPEELETFLRCVRE